MIDDKAQMAQKMLEIKKTGLQLTLKHWYNYELFTWQWWIKLIYLLVPIVIFFKLLDRKRIFEIVTYGLLVCLMSTVSDVLGVYYALWDYPIRFIPSGFFQIHDLVVIPIVSMLVFQYYTSWKPFIIANLILGAIGGYLKEPLYQWIHIYKPINWRHTYSFILYFIIAVISKYIADKIRHTYQNNLAK